MQPLKVHSIPVVSPGQQPEVTLPSLKLLDASTESLDVTMTDMVAAQID
jgi:hypothetical protein